MLSQLEMYSEGLMTNNVAGRTNVSLLEFVNPLCVFLRPHQQQYRSVGGTGIWESICAAAERLWMAALGIEQNKAQSELKQAAPEKQQHTVIQPLACAPEHCVYICNLTYPLGSQRTPLPHHHHPSLSLFLYHHNHVLSASHSLSALMSTLFLSFSLSRSHHHVTPFFSYTKIIVKQIHPHTFSLWHPYTNTPRALKIHPCVKIARS